MKRSFRVLLALTALSTSSSPAFAKDRPPYHAYFDPTLAQPSAPARSVAALGAGAMVAHRDERRGTPTFLWAARDAQPALPLGASVESAARGHLARHADLFGVTSAALATARVRDVHDPGRGAIVVVFEQAPRGVPVFHGDVKVLMRRDLSLVAIAGAPRPDAVDGAGSRDHAAFTREEAVVAAVTDLYDAAISVDALAPSGGSEPWLRFELASAAGGPGIRFDRPARVRPVLFPLPDRLVPAYEVELFAREGDAAGDAYGYVIGAREGRILYRASLQQADTFAYRVWAEPAGDKRPLDGPVADFTPHPAGAPDGTYPPFIDPDLVSIDGFNGPADPWLSPGATQSKGNNVDAYTDHDDPDGFSAGDLRATTTSAGVFDRTYDVALSPLSSADQSMAAVAELFYVTNWLHDYWYDSGFDEAAGNAQQSNYGRGGAQGDPLLAEAQDAVLLGAKNNANMATPADGESPRMQMYVWDGKLSQTLDVTPLNQSLSTGAAEFGPQSFSLTADVVLVDDGTATTSDACEPVQNDVTGKIALVHRGSCTFESKALTAQNAGAVGMILSNNQPNQPPPAMPAVGLPQPVTIASLSVTQEDGAALETALLAGTVTAAMTRTAAVDVDGTIDNLVVAHEWGHYLHHRLVACGLNQCGGQSEGWGDFVALTLQLRPADDLTGTFADAVYATAATPDAAYFGTRRMPYTTDLTKNPLTFQHIQSSSQLPVGQPMQDAGFDNAEVHNTGEIWCSMLWEGYAGLLGASKGPNPPYDFEAARRRMADYVVAGMKLAPPEPTFTEQRDAILAAAMAADEADAFVLAQAFAKRGAGSCAVSPPKDSFDNEGVVESFTTAPEIAITAITLDDSVASCDGDGLLDGEETGKVTVQLVNRGLVAAPSTTVTLASTTKGVTFPGGAQATITDLGALSAGAVTFDVAVDGTVAAPVTFDFGVAVASATACDPAFDTARKIRINYDDAPAASATDTFESSVDVWTRDGDSAEEIWQRSSDPDTANQAWHGSDVSGITDTALVSPELTVSSTQPLVVSFAHRHSFEASPADPADPTSPMVFWDGGVVEYSDNHGATWKDAASLADPGYGGTIGNLADNPLADQDAFVERNPSWPDFDTVTVDLGTALAGETVQLRFRIGTDQAAGDFGWEIDDVAFQGIVGTPFPAVVDDAGSCSPSHPPVADAGANQSVTSGTLVALDGSGSSDPDGDALTFTWTQTDGPPVEISDASTAAPTFTAPAAATAQVVVGLELTVDAVDGTATDSVTIYVSPPGPTTGPSTQAGPSFDGLAAAGGGCRCRAAGGEQPAGPGATVGLLLALAALSRRRRRMLRPPAP